MHDTDTGRYRLLETVREYAQERLAASPDAAATRLGHLRHYVALAEAALPELFGPRQGEWLGRLDRERDNFLAAHAQRDADPVAAELGLRLVSALKPYFLTRGLLLFARRLIAEALASAGEAAAPRPRARALFDAGQLSYYMGRYAEARPYLEAVLRSAREMQHRPMLVAVLQPLAMACIGEGQNDVARAHLDEALAVAREIDDRHALLVAQSARAQLDRLEGRLAAADERCAHAVALAREIGHDESLASALLNLAMLRSDQGRIAEAQATVAEAAQLGARTESQLVGQSVVEVTAGLAADLGQWDLAARLAGAAAARGRETGVHRDPADEAYLAPRLDRARRALGPQRYAEALEEGAHLAFADALMQARTCLQPSGAA
jgi:tetratricopeptide (TPR) repeat protein